MSTSRTSRLPFLAFFPAIAFAYGCMRSPKVDPNRMTCRTDDNCLPGYSCNMGTGTCRPTGNQASDGSAILDGADAPSGNGNPDGPQDDATPVSADARTNLGTETNADDASPSRDAPGSDKPPPFTADADANTASDAPQGGSSGAEGPGGGGGASGAGARSGTGGLPGTGAYNDAGTQSVASGPDAGDFKADVSTTESSDSPLGCSAPTHDDGTGQCVVTGCADGYHNGGGGACVGAGLCQTGYHDNGAGTCVASGCATGYRDGGDGSCVPLGACAPGYHDNGVGSCVKSGCAVGYHDGGDGTCRTAGTCSTGYHDGGDGTCLPSGACTSGYHDGGSGICVTTGTCNAGYHNSGSGTCIQTGCAATYHDGGDGTCVPFGSCSAGFHDVGGGQCGSPGTCTTGYHNDGTGTCVQSGCAAGYHDGGDGTCLSTGKCSSGFAIGLAGDCLADGTALWAQSTTSGTASSWFPALAADASGNVYAAGIIYGTGTYGFGNGVSVVGIASQNAILVKYDPLGNAIWARAPSSAVDKSSFYAVTVDADGNAYVVGSINGTGTYGFGNGITAAGAFNGTNLAIVKFTPSGDAVWATSTSSASAISTFNSVVWDSVSGSIYAAGSLGSGSFAVPGGVSSLVPSASGGAFWIQFNTSGVSTGAATVTTASGSSTFSSVTTDSAGNIYAAGLINGTGTFAFNNSGSVTAVGAATGQNLLLVRYDRYGSPLWAKSVTSGTASSSFSAVAVDALGGVYAAGSINGTNAFGLGNGISISGTATSSAVMVKYDLTGAAQWARSANPGPGISGFNSVTCDTSGSVYGAGMIYSTAAYGFGTGSSVNGSATENAVLVKYDSAGNGVWARSTVSGSNSLFSAVVSSPQNTIYASGELFGTVSFYSGVSATGSNTTGGANAAIVRYLP